MNAGAWRAMRRRAREHRRSGNSRPIRLDSIQLVVSACCPAGLLRWRVERACSHALAASELFRVRATARSFKHEPCLHSIAGMSIAFSKLSAVTSNTHTDFASTPHQRCRS
jgi:hypothetical protein